MSFFVLRADPKCGCGSWWIETESGVIWGAKSFEGATGFDTLEEAREFVAYNGRGTGKPMGATFNCPATITVVEVTEHPVG